MSTTRTISNYNVILWQHLPIGPISIYQMQIIIAFQHPGLLFLEKQHKQKEIEKKKLQVQHINQADLQDLKTLCQNSGENLSDFRLYNEKEADTVFFFFLSVLEVIAVRNITRNKGLFQILKAIAAHEKNTKSLLIQVFEAWQHQYPIVNVNCMKTRPQEKI